MAVDTIGASERLEKEEKIREEGIARLYQPSGEPIWGNVEHERRVAMYDQGLQEAIAAARETAEAAKAEAERDALAGSADPTMGLSPSDLADASARSGFVKEECETMTPEALAKRVRWAAVSGSPSVRWLYARYAQERFQRESSQNPRNPGLAPLAEAMRALSEQLRDKETEAKVSRATAQRDAAIDLQVAAKRAADRLTGKPNTWSAQVKQMF